MPQPLPASAAVRAIYEVREHSRACHDVHAREYLIRVERRMMALLASHETLAFDSVPPVESLYNA